MRTILSTLIVALGFLLGSCSSGPTEVEANATQAPAGPDRDAGLAFLQQAKPEEALIGGQPAPYRGIVLNAQHQKHTIDANTWEADVLLPDGRVITIHATHTRADTFNRTVRPGAYIACKPDGTGAVYEDELVVLHTSAIKVGQ